ncbi:TetR/AcrR family transcriptional regulator [Nocardiopsis gilva YIM 90087]|uniref:TetR/AcrR family transcriptional regulator n=1 Tax=Nocardiopsis gilva YIM 90087 TaxID=1235441 RepID=A0A223S7D9_9ACTN|nr:TetR/AcrR family transcriptional regulator [Nocardiopsis gilva]ASU84037.1 TetR/AcrR family transcriptional regulator [Nocardiopsis gilva YIM 90087]
MTAKRAKPGPRSEERRERIIAAGYRAMVRSGLAGARTRDVAAEAGITVATLHYYFPTKDDLVRAVLEHTIRERMLAPLRLEADWADGLAGLRTMLTGLSQQAEADPGHFRLLHEMTWISREDPAVRTMLARWHEDWHRTIAGWLDAGQRDGRVRADLDAQTVAGMVMYLVLGMVMRPPMPSGVDGRLAIELDLLLSPIAPSPAD